MNLHIKLVPPPFWLIPVLAGPVVIGLIWAFGWFMFELGKYAARHNLTPYEACGHAGVMLLAIAAVIVLVSSIRLPAAPTGETGA